MLGYSCGTSLDTECSLEQNIQDLVKWKAKINTVKGLNKSLHLSPANCWPIKCIKYSVHQIKSGVYPVLTSSSKDHWEPTKQPAWMGAAVRKAPRVCRHSTTGQTDKETFILDSLVSFTHLNWILYKSKVGAPPTRQRRRIQAAFFSVLFSTVHHWAAVLSNSHYAK